MGLLSDEEDAVVLLGEHGEGLVVVRALHAPLLLLRWPANIYTALAYNFQKN